MGNRDARYRRAQFAFCWFLGLLQASVAFGDDAALLEAVSIGHAAWLRDTEFRSTYKKYSGAARSIEQGLSGDLSNRQLHSQGVFHKRGAKIRYSVHYASPPRDISVRHDGSQVGMVPHDSVGTEEIEINLVDRPDQKKAAVAIVTGRRKSFENEPVPGLLWAADSLGPLSLLGGAYRGPLALLPADAGPESQDGQVRLAKELEGGLVQVTILAKDEMRATEKRVLFDITAVPPCVTQMEWIDRNVGRDNVSFRIVARATDFIDCPGGKVPRIVRNVSQNGKDIRVTEWVSEDLGLQSPTDNDFRVEVPAYCRVAGLVTTPPIGAVRRLAPDEFTIADLKVAHDPEPLLAPTGFPDRYRRPLWGGLGLVGLALIFVGTYWWRRDHER